MRAVIRIRTYSLGYWCEDPRLWKSACEYKHTRMRHMLHIRTYMYMCTCIHTSVHVRYTYTKYAYIHTYVHIHMSYDVFFRWTALAAVHLRRRLPPGLAGSSVEIVRLPAAGVSGLLPTW